MKSDARFAILALVAAGVALVRLCSSRGDDAPATKGRPVSFVQGTQGLLCVVDGALYFQGFTKAKPSSQPAQVEQISYEFLWAESTIQAVTQWNEPAKSADQAGSHLWYLTADYGTDPPRVVL